MKCIYKDMGKFPSLFQKCREIKHSERLQVFKPLTRRLDLISFIYIYIEIVSHTIPHLNLSLPKRSLLVHSSKTNATYHLPCQLALIKLLK